MPFRVLDPPCQLTAFMLDGIQGLAARRNYLAPFSTNPSHVDAQAVTITLMKRSSFWPGLALQR
jgi:hypothetical protein